MRIFSFIFFVTGATALLYETVWQKFLTTLTGSDFKGTSIVLGIMLGCMGLGYYYFGKKSIQLNNYELVKLTGIIEILIGIFAFSFPLSYQFFDWILNNYYSNSFLEIIFSFLLIGPPSFLLGGNLPLITQALSKAYSPSEAHCKLYISNTLGACFGCLFSGFILVPQLGLNFTIISGGIVNIIAGSFLYKTKLSNEDRAENLTKVVTVNRLLLLYYLAFISGAIGTSLQNVLIRLLGVTMGSSEYVFSIVVATYVLLLGFGTKILVDKLQLSISRIVLISILGISLIYLSAPEWAYIFHLLRIQMPNEIFGFYLYHFLGMLVFILFSVLAILPTGAILPSLFALINQESKKSGDLVGYLYSLNAFGCIFGCFVSGYVIFAFYNISQVLLILLILSCFTYVLLNYYYYNKLNLSNILFISVLLIICSLAKWPIERFAIGLFHFREQLENSYSGSSKFYANLIGNAQILAHKDGVNASVSVVEFQSNTSKQDYNRSIMINGKPDGNTEGDREMMQLISLTGGAFLNPNSVNNVAVVGFGTGLTTGLLLKMPWIHSVDTIEIAQEVIDLASYFDFANGGVTSNKNHNFILADGFHYFSRNKKKYQLIISQLSNFWMSGIEKLFTKEFYILANKNLDNEGIFVQWLSLWGLSAETARIAISTFAASFPEVKVFAYNQSFVMIGKNKPFTESDLLFVGKNISSIKEFPDIKKLGITNIDQFLMNERWLTKFENLEIQTISKPMLAYYAGRDFYLNKNSHFDDLIVSWPETLKASTHSLTGLWTQTHNLNLDLDTFGNIVKNTCGQSKINIIEPDWRFSRTICRESLIELMKAGKVKIPEMIKTDFLWLEAFKNNNLEPARSVKQALVYISRFATFYSIFDRLPFEKLNSLIEICYQTSNQNCLEKVSNLKKDINLTGK